MLTPISTTYIVLHLDGSGGFCGGDDDVENAERNRRSLTAEKVRETTRVENSSCNQRTEMTRSKAGKKRAAPDREASQPPHEVGPSSSARDGRPVWEGNNSKATPAVIEEKSLWDRVRRGPPGYMGRMAPILRHPI